MSEVKLPVNITAKFIKDLLDAGVTKIEIKADGSISIEKEPPAAVPFVWPVVRPYYYDYTSFPRYETTAGALLPIADLSGATGQVSWTFPDSVTNDPELYED